MAESPKARVKAAMLNSTLQALKHLHGGLRLVAGGFAYGLFNTAWTMSDHGEYLAALVMIGLAVLFAFIAVYGWSGIPNQLWLTRAFKWIVRIGALVWGGYSALVIWRNKGSKSCTNLTWDDLTKARTYVSYLGLIPSRTWGTLAIGMSLGVLFTIAMRWKPRLQVCPDKQLHVLAETDKALVKSLVWVVQILYQEDFDKSQPSINFVFVVFNNSIFDILIDGSIGDGYILFGADYERFHFDPKFEGRNPTLCRGRSGTNFVIRQAVTQDEITRRFKKADNTLITFGNLHLSFSGIGSFPEIPPTPLDTNHYLETAKREWRNPNHPELLSNAIPVTGQTEVEQALILSRADFNNLQQQHETLRNEKESLASKLEELERHKLLLDVDLNLRMEGLECRKSSLILFREKGVFNPPGIEPVLIDRYELRVGLRIRFDNRSSSPQREQSVSVILLTDTDSHQLHIAAYEDGHYIQTLSDVHVQGGGVSPYYDLTCDTNLNPETVDQLTSDSYLRVTLDAINQDPYCVDLGVDWQKARDGKEVFFAERRKGSCAA